MRKLLMTLALGLAVTLAASHADAASIRGRLGLTGRLGFLVPADNRAEFSHNGTDSGFVGGGGLIYGVDDYIAVSGEITHTSFGSDTGDFGVTDFELGGQYRLQPRAQLVPFVGAGLDILVTDYEPYAPVLRDVDTMVGFHIKGGVDYFIQRQLALTAEAKIVLAPDADITNHFGAPAGNFDPSSFSGTVGVRYFFH